MSRHRIIIVLGVRRSGTSAITKGLETVGVSVVDQALTPFNISNEKGYWEDLEFHAFNMKLINELVELEQRRRGMMLLTEEEVDFLCERGFLKKASDLVLSRFLKLWQPLGIKDPRFSILLPFWKRVFKANGIAASYVIALRDPLSTVASMRIFGERQRDASAPLEKFFWIWITSILGAMDASEGEDRIIVDYGELLSDPAFQMRRLADTFKLEIQKKALENYSAHFIDSKLCHFKNQTCSRHAMDDAQSFAIEIYEKLFAVAKGEALWEGLQQVREEWSRRLGLARSLLILAEKNEQAMLMLQVANLAQQQTIDKMSLHDAPRNLS